MPEPTDSRTTPAGAGDPPIVGQVRAPRPHRWLTSVIVVAILLTLTGYLNIRLNETSGQATTLSSGLLQLDSRLHEEGTLQWRALAERGVPTRVAADVGRVRAAESRLLEELAALMTPDDLATLQAMVVDYHDTLDQELSLLAVGRTEDAIAFEMESTTPLFTTLSAWLQEQSGAAAEAADQRGQFAHLVLVAALALAAVVIGALVWRADRAHRQTAAVSDRLLERERSRVEDLRESEAQVRHQAEHDPLTGLANRLRFNRELAAATDRADCAVLFADLDGFKAVNDRWGHAVGDELLVAVAERLRAASRASDTVARLGGDEFAVLLEGADRDLADEVAVRIGERLAAPVQLSGPTVSICASVGVATGRPGADPDQLLLQADHAMYAVKHSRAAAVKHSRAAGVVAGR